VTRIADVIERITACLHDEGSIDRQEEVLPGLEAIAAPVPTFDVADRRLAQAAPVAELLLGQPPSTPGFAKRASQPRGQLKAPPPGIGGEFGGLGARHIGVTVADGACLAIGWQSTVGTAFISSRLSRPMADGTGPTGVAGDNAWSCSCDERAGRP
jgi:hypothetical protein